MYDDINALIKSIPVYQELYGPRIAEFDLGKNLDSFPVLEKKHIVKGFPGNFMTPALGAAMEKGELEFNASSGTTSERMQIVREPNWWRGENRRTYEFDARLCPFIHQHKKAVLTTAICSNTVCFAKLPAYEERIMGMTFYLNISPDPNQWTRTDIERMVQEINQYQPDILDADPIYLALFLHKYAQYEISTPLHQPKVMILTYEYITHFSRAYIRRFFPQVPNMAFYGSTETGYNLFEMEDGRYKHVEDQCLLNLEHLQDDIYFLKTSAWKNRFMPLINYKIGDLVRIKPENLHLWDNSSKTPQLRVVDQLCGRFFDVTMRLDGSYVTVGDIELVMKACSAPLLVYQVRFINPTLCHFRYVVAHGEEAAAADLQQIQQGLQKLYGAGITVEMVREQSIAPEMSGKFCVAKKA